MSGAVSKSIDRVDAVELAGFLEEPLGEFADLHADGLGEAAYGDRQGDLDRTLDLGDQLLLAAQVLAQAARAGPRREPHWTSIISTATSADDDRTAIDAGPALAALVGAALVRASRCR